MQSLFFSYAQEDSPVVTRVYEDLLRTGGDLRLWCYEKTSEFGVDFRREYGRRISEAGHFILFDSPHARSSGYVSDEILLWRSHPDCKMHICLVEPEGPWRDQELFDGQNFIVYFDLTDYGEGIRRLCEHFDVTYVPRFIEPRDLDFDAELRRHGGRFRHGERQAMLDGYQRFRDLCIAKPRTAEAQLRVLIDAHLGGDAPPIVAPYLALAMLQAEDGRAADALDTFCAAATAAPEDPRGWAGSGNAAFALGRYDAAVEHYRRCIECIEASNDAVHERHRSEMVYGLVSALFARARVEEALSELAMHRPDLPREPEFLSLEGRVLMAAGDSAAAAPLFYDAYELCRDKMSQPAEVLLDLIDAFRSFDEVDVQRELLEIALTGYPENPQVLRAAAIFYSGTGELSAAISYYETIMARTPDTLWNLAEFALLLHATGDKERKREVLDRCLSSEVRPSDEDYYLGLAHFLAGRRECADYYFSRSKRDPLVRDWVFYEDLL